MLMIKLNLDFFTMNIMFGFRIQSRIGEFRKSLVGVKLCRFRTSGERMIRNRLKLFDRVTNANSTL